ncbi:hypothetical protein QC762_0035350 [Podospora pseudocomata]|uniref:Uncharacterized protein n=1 Tax=Podospora pseudocomata TaxID=2093779 RepID=A0ABR0GQX2_9PEZI|nr:hypothetical protein QC762_0035350 [Podospora pseudocomata]
MGCISQQHLRSRSFSQKPSADLRFLNSTHNFGTPLNIAAANLPERNTCPIVPRYRTHEPLSEYGLDVGDQPRLWKSDRPPGEVGLD